MPMCKNNTISQVLFYNNFYGTFLISNAYPHDCNLVRPFPLLSILLLILSTPVLSKLNQYLYLYSIFSPLSINKKTLLITENEIILSRRGTHLGRLKWCPLVKLYIMTKKNRYSIDIIFKTAELKMWPSCLVTTDDSNKVIHTQHERIQN